MIWGIITVFLDSIDEVLRQKSLNYGKGVSKSLYNFLGFFGGLFLAILLLIFGVLNFGELGIFFNNPIIFLLLIAIIVINMVISPLWQIVYKSQKISSILPYQKISSLLIIIISFFWLGGTSLFSFMITLIILIGLVVVGVDFKNFQGPSNKGLIFLIQGMEVIDSLITIYMLKLISESFYYTIYVIGGFIIVSLFLSVYYGIRSFCPIISQSKNFYLTRFGSSLSGYGSWLISLFLITEFGPIITFLLGFLGVGVTLLMSYVFQGDKPEKKDIILAIIVTLLVGIAYYFK